MVTKVTIDGISAGQARSIRRHLRTNDQGLTLDEVCKSFRRVPCDAVEKLLELDVIAGRAIKMKRRGHVVV